MKRLAILGAGDLGQQIAHHALLDKHYIPIGFFDDNVQVGILKFEIPVIGQFSEALEQYQNGLFDCIIIAVGYSAFDVREKLYDRYFGVIPFANIVHSSCYIDESCKMGSGIFIYPGCVLDCNTVIEDNVILNIGCLVAHDSTIQRHSILAPGVNIAGFVNIGRKVHVGIGVTIIDNISISANVKIGGGAVVVDSINQRGVYYGVPAKFKRE